MKYLLKYRTLKIMLYLGKNFSTYYFRQDNALEKTSNYVGQQGILISTNSLCILGTDWLTKPSALRTYKIIGNDCTICKLVGERKWTDLLSACSFWIENCEIWILDAISLTKNYWNSNTKTVNWNKFSFRNNSFSFVIQKFSTSILIRWNTFFPLGICLLTKRLNIYKFSATTIP